MYGKTDKSESKSFASLFSVQLFKCRCVGTMPDLRRMLGIYICLICFELCFLSVTALSFNEQSKVHQLSIHQYDKEGLLVSFVWKLLSRAFVGSTGLDRLLSISIAILLKSKLYIGHASCLQQTLLSILILALLLTSCDPPAPVFYACLETNMVPPEYVNRTIQKIDMAGGNKRVKFKFYFLNIYRTHFVILFVILEGENTCSAHWPRGIHTTDFVS